jgi:hypothetical protein
MGRSEIVSNTEKKIEIANIECVGMENCSNLRKTEA